MPDEKSVTRQQPAAYRRFAAQCLEVAEYMSRENRERMIEMAQRWLDLAQKAESGQG